MERVQGLRRRGLGGRSTGEGPGNVGGGCGGGVWGWGQERGLGSGGQGTRSRGEVEGKWRGQRCRQGKGSQGESHGRVGPESWALFCRALSTCACVCFESVMLFCKCAPAARLRHCLGLGFKVLVLGLSV